MWYLCAQLMLCVRSALGYPEGHADSNDKASDVDYLFEKQQAGADFVVTQLFYNTDVFIKWYESCRSKGAGLANSRID